VSQASSFKAKLWSSWLTLSRGDVVRIAPNELVFITPKAAAGTCQLTTHPIDLPGGGALRPDKMLTRTLD
jgi:hypothetical protein